MQPMIAITSHTHSNEPLSPKAQQHHPSKTPGTVAAGAPSWPTRNCPHTMLLACQVVAPFSAPEIGAHRLCAEQEDAVCLACSAYASHCTQRCHDPIRGGCQACKHGGSHQRSGQEERDAPAPAVAQPAKETRPNEGTHEHQLQA